MPQWFANSLKTSNQPQGLLISAPREHRKMVAEKQKGSFWEYKPLIFLHVCCNPASKQKGIRAKRQSMWSRWHVKGNLNREEVYNVDMSPNDFCACHHSLGNFTATLLCREGQKKKKKSKELEPEWPLIRLAFPNPVNAPFSYFIIL